MKERGVNQEIEDESAIKIMMEVLEDAQLQEFPELDSKLVEDFRSLLLDTRFTYYTETLSSLDSSHSSIESSSGHVPITDKKIADIVKQLVRGTALIGSDDKLFDATYKRLVKKFSSALNKEKNNPLEAEVAARKLAAWILKYNEKLRQEGTGGTD